MAGKNKWWRPNLYTPLELETKANEYFSLCDSTKIKRWINWIFTKPKTLSWLCIYLNVSKDYISEKLKQKKFSETIKRIRLEVENDIEEKALLWIYSPTASSFNLKNNFSWTEKSEQRLVDEEWNDRDIIIKLPEIW